MKIDLIKNYISKLKKQDIIDYLNKEEITADSNEIDLIYKTIKDNYQNIEAFNFEENIKLYKDKLNENLYKKIFEKYNKYKKFIE